MLIDWCFARLGGIQCDCWLEEFRMIIHLFLMNKIFYPLFLGENHLFTRSTYSTVEYVVHTVLVRWYNNIHHVADVIILILGLICNTKKELGATHTSRAPLSTE
jgi:hypothetical protein